ncbi:MAG: ParB N-terminal domain-containing protein [Rhodospirillaceae bacterium]|nr:ParB N-terminal domain-containing protein [Rhodospirillaceae bacterium]
MLKAVSIKIEDVYVPAERRKELDASKLDQVAETIMEEVEENPIQVRQGKGRYVLVKGIHRLEAHKALGDESIQAFIVGARLH